MSKYNVKCPSCGIDINFDDIPEGNEIECGVCGTFVELNIPEEKPLEQAINRSPSPKAETADSKSAPSPETDNGNSNKASIDFSQEKAFDISPSCRNFREVPLTDKQNNTAPIARKGFPWIPLLASALGLILILISFLIVVIMTRKSVNENTPSAPHGVVNDYTQPANANTLIMDKTQEPSTPNEPDKATNETAVGKDRSDADIGIKTTAQKSPDTNIPKKAAVENPKLEDEKKVTFSLDIDEEKVKVILIAECKTSTESIEKGKNKSVNEINEEIKIEQDKLIALKFPESMLDQKRKEANSKFNKDDMPTADMKFPQEMLAGITSEANDKFKLIKVGDTVTMPKRQSAGYIDITGTYYGITGDKITVKESKILIKDLPVDIQDMLTEDGVNKRKSAYIGKMYHIPKENYEKQRCHELEKAKQNISEYIQANYFNPKLEYTKTSRKEVSEKLFREYGFVFNNTKNTWEYFGDYIKSKYSEFRNLKKEMFTLMQNSEIIQRTYETNFRLYNESAQDLVSLKSKSLNAPEILRLSAFLIAMKKENLYEIAMTEYDSNSGTREPTDKHAILITENSRFSFKGHFSMDVVILDSVPVKLKDEFGGFSQNWTIYKEATYKDKRIFSELTEKENKVALLKTRLDDSIQQKQKTEMRIQEIKTILSQYAAL